MMHEQEQAEEQRLNIVHFCWFNMPQALNPSCTYSYTHRDLKGQPHAITVHDISIRENRMLIALSYFGTLLVVTSFCCLLLLKEKLSSSSGWRILLAFIITKFLQYNSVKKESLVIMPEFGVQLETHYWSGRVSFRFVPAVKILRPALHERVTPVTCYWSLVLVLRGEEQLLVVFKKVQPPLSILVPVWKALCAAAPDC